MLNKKILILGANGLLGNNIYNFLKNKKLTLYTCTRKKNNNFNNNFTYGNLLRKNSKKKIEKIIKKLNPYYVINCTGITKHKKSNFVEMKKINYDFVCQILSLITKYEFKYIHLSTDCVFSGKDGNYKETSIQDATDNYGITKSMAEKLCVKNKNVLTLRCSTIGHENFTKNGLLDWFLSKSKVFGFKKAFFSGPTSLELAKIIFKFILDKNVLKRGIYNIACQKISKFKLLQIINKIYKKKIIIMSKNNFIIDRSLNPNKFKKKTKYLISSWKVQIKNMYKFKNEISKK
jgi:dTDP-4-dehydrorhamnose reductase